MPSTLPSSRAFVVQIAADTDDEGRGLSGRVEHVSSGKSTRFRALDEVQAFIARTLREEEAGGGPTHPG